MANMKGTANSRNSGCSGKQPFLPPKSPFPSVSAAYTDYGCNPCPVPKGIPKPRESQNHHQRTSSESFLFEEQPSWLDDLLNEPDTPLRRGTHRRSSSDSFAYLNMSNIACNLDNNPQEELMQRLASQSWGYREPDHGEGKQYISYCPEGNSFARPQDRGWEPGLNTVNYPSSLPAGSDMIRSLSPGPSGAVKDSDAVMPTGTKKIDQEESAFQDPRCLERLEDTYPRNSQSEADPKRAKQ